MSKNKTTPEDLRFLGKDKVNGIVLLHVNYVKLEIGIDRIKKKGIQRTKQDALKFCILSQLRAEKTEVEPVEKGVVFQTIEALEIDDFLYQKAVEFCLENNLIFDDFINQSMTDYLDSAIKNLSIDGGIIYV